MVDLVDIGLRVDSSDFVKAAADTKGFELAVAKMVQTILRENGVLKAASKASADARAEAEQRAIQKQIEANQKLTAIKEKEAAKQQAILDRQAKAEMDVYVRTTLAAEKAAAAKAKTVQANVGGNLGLGAVGVSAGASASAISAEVDRLRLKYDQIYASSKRYESALNELNRAEMLGAISDKQRQASLDALNSQMANGTGIFANYSQQVGRGTNRMGVAFQQTGYQVSDFIVQIQGGTNPLVAFSQQATQLAGLMYLLPPAMQAARLSFVYFSISVSAAMAAVTILIPLLSMLVMAFVNANKASEDTSKSVDKQTQAYDGLISKIEELRLARQMEASGAVTKEEQVVQNTLNTLLVERVDLQDRLNKLKDIGGRATAFSEEKKAQVDLLQVDIDKNTEALKAIDYERTLSAAANRRANERRDAYREEKKLADAQALAEQVAADKSTYLKNVFHAMAGEAGAVSTSLKGWAGEILNAAGAMSALGQYMFKVNNLSGMMGRGLPAGGMPANFTPYSPTDYSGRTYGGAFAEGRMEGSSTPPKVKKTAGGGAEKKDPLAELQKQIALQEELNGKTEAEQKVRQALGESWSNYSPVVIKGLEDQIQKQIELEDRIKSQQQVFDTVKSSMEDAFMGIVSGTESAKDAFKSMALAIIKELYNVLVVQRMVGSFDQKTGQGNGIMGAIFKGIGGLFGGGSGYRAGMAGRANGGSIDAGTPYMVGERGPEMIIPKSSGMVLTNGQTKAALGGSSNDNYVVHNNITVTGSDSVMVRQEIAKMIPQISSATKAAMIDAKRRGGQMGNAFR